MILSGYSGIADSSVGVVQQVMSISTAVINMVSKGIVIVCIIALSGIYTERAETTESPGALLSGGIRAYLKTQRICVISIKCR